jgi:cytidine deaminase
MMPDEAWIERLKPLAVLAASKSHSPYSRFRVGVALTAPSGAEYSACNVENASFGLTLCADRNALATAIADGVLFNDTATTEIYTPGERAHSPCGACRQVILELMSAASRVASVCDGDDMRVWTASDLLPQPFTPESLSFAGQGGPASEGKGP